MGTELLRACLKEEDLDFLAVPPGFESFTSFKSKTLENADSEPCCSVSSNLSRQEPVDVKSEAGYPGGGKITRSLRRRPSMNYGRYNQCSDEESDCEKLDQNFPTKPGLPKGVIRGCTDCQNCQKVIARWHPEGSCRADLEEVPVFYPNEEEFKDTIRYIEKIRPIAEIYGICRIVPPPLWKPPFPLKKKDIWEKAKFVTRVQRVDKLQNRDASRKQSKVHNNARKKRRRCSRMDVEFGPGNGKTLELGETEFGFEPGPEFTLDEFQKYADDFKFQYFRNENCTESGTERDRSTENWEPSVANIEGEYWRVVEKPTDEIEVLYGADLDTGVFGSGFPKFSDQGCSASDEDYVKSGWNLNNLPRLAGSVLSYENADISGVQVPWLYVGMCFSSFCWHVEDHHLYSLNYMHYGAPKIWYGVPGREAVKLEEAMKKRLPDLFDEQPDLLHKLVTQLSPSILKSAGVPVYRCVQNAGEFVLTFPRAYHAGFNSGLRCMKMATSLELTIGIEGAYSTSPTKTTDPRLSYMISISNDESLNDNHHNHGVLQKWMHTVLCYKKHSDDSEDYGLHAKGRIKESLGKALLEHPILAGRLRRSENDNGDLRIVSNDSGIRCIDAQISLSLVHFLELSKEKKNEVEGKLLYWKNVDESNPIFSPLFYIQMTKFKCGGYSIGISCSLLLTDPLYMAKFLNKWAKIHMSMVYESEMSKTLSCIYSSYFKFGSEHEYGTIHDSSNTRRKTSKTMIFNISTEETKHYLRDEICKYFVQHCLEKAENIFGSKLGSPFTLMTKEPNGNTKVEIFTRKANFTSPKNLKYELNSSSWEDLKINDVAFQRGNGPIDASHWISCDALEGMVLVVISEAIKGKSGIHVYVTVPIDQDLQEIECY